MSSYRPRAMDTPERADVEFHRLVCRAFLGLAVFWLVVCGESQARAEFNYLYFENGVEEMIRDLSAIENDPDMDSVIGFIHGKMPRMFQSEGQSRVQALIDGLGRKAFLLDEALREAGGIPLATPRISRLSAQGMSEADYKVAIREAKSDLWSLLNVVREQQKLPELQPPFNIPTGKVIDYREW